MGSTLHVDQPHNTAFGTSSTLHPCCTQSVIGRRPYTTFFGKCSMAILSMVQCTQGRQTPSYPGCTTHVQSNQRSDVLILVFINNRVLQIKQAPSTWVIYGNCSNHKALAPVMVHLNFFPINFGTVVVYHGLNG